MASSSFDLFDVHPLLRCGFILDRITEEDEAAEELDLDLLDEAPKKRKKRKKKKSKCSEDEQPPQQEEQINMDEDSSREVTRSNSLKRRDASWDKKWQEHLEKNVVEDMSRSSVFTRSPRLPGKVNRSVWETRLSKEKEEAKRQLPRTPPPVLKVRSNMSSPRPHHGASVLDYHSPARTATPPYPSDEDFPENCPLKPLPPPPGENHDEALPPPPLPLNQDDGALDWKNEMRKEIWRARQNLLNGQDSCQVESVIRLLEQTYDRLKREPEVEAEEASPTTEESAHPPGQKRDENMRSSSQMECYLDTDEADLSKETEFNRLSRSVSGTFQAIPAQIIDAEESEHDVIQDKVVQVRREFCQNMLKASEEMIDRTKNKKFDLMAEIKREVHQIPAIDEVFAQAKPAHKPVVLIDKHSAPQNFESNHDVLEIYETMEVKEYDDIIITQVKPMLLNDPGAPIEQSVIAEEAGKDRENLVIENGLESEEDSNLKEEVTKDEQIQDVFKENLKEDVIKESEFVMHQQESIAEEKINEIPVEVTKPKAKVHHTLPKPSNQRLKKFEATSNSKVFSISGMWSNINLGMVKERSSFWQKDKEVVKRSPNYKNQPKNRNSRLIDPNEWVAPTSPPTTKPLHKSLSVGQLDVEEDSEADNMPISQATVAFESRANGRKSADIFVHNTTKSEEKALPTPSPPPPPEPECDQPIQCKTEEIESEPNTPVVQNGVNGFNESFENIREEFFTLSSSQNEVKESVKTTNEENSVKNEEKFTRTKSEEKSMKMTSEVHHREEFVKIMEMEDTSTISHAASIESMSVIDQPPQVPHRHSSKLAIKKKIAPPKLNIVNAGSLSPDRAKSLAKMEQERQAKEEEEKRVKALREQEKKFQAKMEISQKYKRPQAPVLPPPPKVDYEKPKSNLNQQKLERLKAQELKERMKLWEMERRKREIEEEIEREKQHLANILNMELGVPRSAEPKSFDSLPPPVPPRPATTELPVHPRPTTTELPSKWKADSTENLSLEDTVRDLEKTTLQLKTMAEKKSGENDEAIRQTAGTVREVAQVLLEAVTAPGDEEEDTDGYSEGGEDFSCGIEMPLSMAGVGGQDSGNATPVPTQGELEEISVEELQQPSPRRTPLKSLLKRSMDADETISLPEEPSLTSVRERSSSPRKAVHFSEVDQIKLMSQESLVSTADTSSNGEAHTVNSNVAPLPSSAIVAPKRNQ